MRFLFNLSLLLALMKLNFFIIFCEVHLGISIDIYRYVCCPYLEGHTRKLPLLEHKVSIIQTLLNGRDQPAKRRKVVSPIHHGDTAEGWEMKV